MLLKILLLVYIICLCFLIIFILINKGKGAEIGATFNSSTNDIFGSKGSSSIIKKIIILLAILVLSINLFINIISKDEHKYKNTTNENNIQDYKTQSPNIEDK